MVTKMLGNPGRGNGDIVSTEINTPSNIVSPSDCELVLAGIEFIFTIVASMGLWFGFVLKTVLTMQRCFGYC